MNSMTNLTPQFVYRVLGRHFPAKNDDFPSDYVEELAELQAFGIVTEEQLNAMLSRRAEEVIAIDQSLLDEYDLKLYRKEYGEEFVSKCLKEGRWFSYPALLRFALELEFGEAYQAFADKRDGIVEPTTVAGTTL